MFKNLTVAKRLGLAFALTLLIMIGITFVGVLQMASMRAATRDIADNWLPSVARLNRMNTGTFDYRI